MQNHLILSLKTHQGTNESYGAKPSAQWVVVVNMKGSSRVTNACKLIIIPGAGICTV